MVLLFFSLEFYIFFLLFLALRTRERRERVHCAYDNLKCAHERQTKHKHSTIKTSRSTLYVHFFYYFIVYSCWSRDVRVFLQEKLFSPSGIRCAHFMCLFCTTISLARSEKPAFSLSRTHRIAFILLYSLFILETLIFLSFLAFGVSLFLSLVHGTEKSTNHELLMQKITIDFPY